MLWIRLGLIADSQIQLFYLNADPDPDPASQTDPDPDPGQTSKSQKFEFYMKVIHKVGNRSKNIPVRYLKRY